MIKFLKFQFQLLFIKKITFFLPFIIILFINFLSIFLMGSWIKARSQYVFAEIIPLVLAASFALLLIYTLFFSIKKSGLEILVLSRSKNKAHLFFGNIISILLLVLAASIFVFFLSLLGMAKWHISWSAMGLIAVSYSLHFIIFATLFSFGFMLLSILLRGYNFLFFAGLILICINILLPIGFRLIPMKAMDPYMHPGHKYVVPYNRDDTTFLGEAPDQEKIDAVHNDVVYTLNNYLNPAIISDCLRSLWTIPEEEFQKQYILRNTTPQQPYYKGDYQFLTFSFHHYNFVSKEEMTKIWSNFLPSVEFTYNDKSIYYNTEIGEKGFTQADIDKIKTRIKGNDVMQGYVSTLTTGSTPTTSSFLLREEYSHQVEYIKANQDALIKEIDVEHAPDVIWLLNVMENWTYSTLDKDTKELVDFVWANSSYSRGLNLENESEKIQYYKNEDRTYILWYALLIPFALIGVFGVSSYFFYSRRKIV